MEIKVTINSCGDCKHRDHTGAFTPNGSLGCCRHRESPKDFCMKKHTGREKDNDYLIAKIEDGIPDWCPLKKGAKY
jgi:hypothetical protein